MSDFEDTTIQKHILDSPVRSRVGPECFCFCMEWLAMLFPCRQWYRCMLCCLTFGLVVCDRSALACESSKRSDTDACMLGSDVLKRERPTALSTEWGGKTTHLPAIYSSASKKWCTNRLLSIEEHTIWKVGWILVWSVYILWCRESKCRAVVKKVIRYCTLDFLF